MQGSMQVEKHTELHPWSNLFHNGVSVLPPENLMPKTAMQMIADYVASHGGVMKALIDDKYFGLGDNE